MVDMAAKAWALSLLFLVLTLSGCSALQCHHDGRFWDGCNWCYCRDHVVVGCTNMACVGVPEDAYRIDPNRATIGPPERKGLFAYRPGRGRVVDPSGWPCQLGSSWLEEGGCVRCICANKMIKCRDSGMCLNGEMQSNEITPQTQYVRRRRESAPAPDSAPAAAAPVAAAPTEAATWATDQPEATTAAGGIADAGETTVAPAGADNATATPAPEPVNGTQSTAAPPATTTAQNTVVKDRSCRSGSTWEEDCNSCWCLDNGRAACTTVSCELVPPVQQGAPGASGAIATATAATTSTTAAAAVGNTTVSTSTPAPPPTTPAAVAEPTAASGTRRKRRVVLVSA